MSKPTDRFSRGVRRRVLLLLALVAVGWLGFEVLTWPDVEALTTTAPGKTAFMRRWEARKGQEVSFEWVPYGEIADDVKLAVLVAEDIDFFSHRGFAVHEMRQALRDAWERREAPRGASTITQQLAKNLWLSPSRSPRRKVREALLTRALESRLEKRRILEIYLNVVEFGDGTFGCQAASRHFFGKPAGRLGPREAARLAAVLPRPGRWSPRGDDRSFLAAVERIEGRMRRAGWLRGEI